MIGIASPPNHGWLTAHGVKRVDYGEGLADRLCEAGIDSFIDTHGGGDVELAIVLDVVPDRIDTVADFAAAQKYEVKAEGSGNAKNATVLGELAELVASSDLEVPIAATFPLDDVRAAFELLGSGIPGARSSCCPNRSCPWTRGHQIVTITRPGFVGCSTHSCACAISSSENCSAMSSPSHPASSA